MKNTTVIDTGPDPATEKATEATPEQQAAAVVAQMTKSVEMIMASLSVMTTHMRKLTAAISEFADIVEEHTHSCKKCGDCFEIDRITGMVPRPGGEPDGETERAKTKPEAEASGEEEPRERFCICCRATVGMHEPVTRHCPRPGGGWFHTTFTAATAAERKE